MNGLERVKAALAFAAPDVAPVICQVFGHAATLAGVPLENYLQDGDLLARCQIGAWERYGHDAVFALMDVNVEAEALGARLCRRSGQYPGLKSHSLADAKGLGGLKLPNPNSDGRMPQLLRAAALLRAEFGDSVPVVGCVLGPMTLALQLMGWQEALWFAIDHPDDFERLLGFTTEVGLLFGRAQLESGVHLPLIFDPGASTLVLTPQFFREFAVPSLKKLAEGLKLAGSMATWLHITGPVETILSYYPQIGVDLANIDYMADLAQARETLPTVCLDGNLKPASFVIEEPESIAREAARLVNRFGPGAGYILSQGCELPLESRPENVRAMVAAGREAGVSCPA